jgi:hypothetical protein
MVVFIISWESNNQDGDGYGIYSQKFDFFGNAITINPSSLGDDNQFVLVANGYVYFSELFSE